VLKPHQVSCLRVMNDTRAFRQYKTMMPQEKKRGGGCRFFGCAFLLILVIVGGYGFLQYANYQTFTKPTSVEASTVNFEVKEGETLDSIAARLVEEKILVDKKVFTYPAYKVFLKLNTVQSNGIQAGVHKIPVPVSPVDVFSYLRSERCADEVKVTLREGLRMEEFAEELDKTFQGKSNVNFSKSEFFTLAKNYQDSGKFAFTAPKDLEGFLFPDTYNFCADVSTVDVIDRLLLNFNTKVAIPLKTQIASSAYSLEQIATIASMLEREARGAEAQSMVADVIIKRLEAGMPLGIDATTQYGHGYSDKAKTWWVRGVELDQIIEIDNKYNTRTRVGLPPTPISNSGEAAFKAVLNPTKNSYYFYITGNDGKMYYARDLSGHNLNVCKYITMQCR
jgi:UPF0755 protein